MPSPNATLAVMVVHRLSGPLMLASLALQVADISVIGSVSRYKVSSCHALPSHGDFSLLYVEFAMLISFAALVARDLSRASDLMLTASNTTETIISTDGRICAGYISNHEHSRVDRASRSSSRRRRFFCHDYQLRQTPYGSTDICEHHLGAGRLFCHIQSYATCVSWVMNVSERAGEPLEFILGSGAGKRCGGTCFS